MDWSYHSLFSGSLLANQFSFTSSQQERVSEDPGKDGFVHCECCQQGYSLTTATSKATVVPREPGLLLNHTKQEYAAFFVDHISNDYWSLHCHYIAYKKSTI